MLLLYAFLFGEEMAVNPNFETEWIVDTSLQLLSIAWFYKDHVT